MMDEFIHTADGELKLNNPFIVEGTKVRIIKPDDMISIGPERVGYVGVIDAHSVEMNIKYAGKRLYAHYERESRYLYCYKSMLEVI